MKKLKTLAFSFKWINKLLDELEKNERLDVVEEYYTNRANSKDWADFVFLSQNQPYNNEYTIPYALYERMFKKSFPKFYLLWSKFDFHFGNISPTMNAIYMFKQVLNYCYRKNNLNIGTLS